MRPQDITMGNGSLSIDGVAVGLLRTDRLEEQNYWRERIGMPPVQEEDLEEALLLDDMDPGPVAPQWWQRFSCPSVHPLAWRVPFCLLAAAILAYADVSRWTLPLSYVLGGLCTLLLGYGGSKAVIGSDPWEDIYS